MKTKTVQLPGVTQEEEDARFQALLDKKREDLDARDAALKKSILEGIAASAEKNPRRDVARVSVSRSERSSGLRL